jgi:hypothetical protein
MDDTVFILSYSSFTGKVMSGFLWKTPLTFIAAFMLNLPESFLLRHSRWIFEAFH